MAKEYKKDLSKLEQMRKRLLRDRDRKFPAVVRIRKKQR